MRFEQCHQLGTFLSLTLPSTTQSAYTCCSAQQLATESLTKIASMVHQHTGFIETQPSATFLVFNPLPFATTELVTVDVKLETKFEGTKATLIHSATGTELPFLLVCVSFDGDVLSHPSPNKFCWARVGGGCVGVAGADENR